MMAARVSFSAALLMLLVHSALGQSTPIPTVSATPTASASPTLTPPPTATPSPTPILLADVNCDERGTAADFTAAVLVAYGRGWFLTCPGADFYRNPPLSDRDFLPLFNDVFSTFAVPWTPTPTLSPTITGTPTRTGTFTVVPTPTRTPLVSPSPSATSSASPTLTFTATPTVTPTHTATFLPTRTRTPTSSPSRTLTPLPSPTRTPTGFAQQLTGSWYADWANGVGAICYDPTGLEFFKLPDGVYEVTAVNGRLDITTASGISLGRGLAVTQNGTSGTVHFVYNQDGSTNCFGAVPEYVFDFTFTFRMNGSGDGSSHWTYGFNTNCFVCDKSDTVVFRRLSGP